jgi:serine/threonine-protein kinase
MGVVYRAYDQVLKCDVAVKMIRDTPDPTALELFRRECEVLSGLNHPNIVPILDLGEFEQDGQMRPFFVMPLLPGATLDRIIKGSSQLTVQRSVDVLTQVCRGLSAAHERGLIHRDLKPGNIFVMPDDSVEIIDFGVAHMTNAGATVGQKGTLLFMAPELLEMKPPTPLSDIFALGVMAYQMFTRRRPFQRNTEREIMEAILHETPPAISDLDPEVNQAISRVVHKSMAKQPWHRFSTAREFGECLQKAYRGEPIEYFDPARIRPRVERAKKAFEQGDYQFASEILVELDAEGHLDPEMSQVRRQIDVAMRQKRVQQLLESARTRLEEDEYPLALQKVQEALSLEPESAEALGLKAEIESTSSERQIEGWLRLVRQHIDNSAYGHAREALQNVMQMRPDDGRPKALLSEVDRLEQEHIRARNEKDHLYQAAVEDYQKGEVSSALGKLEKVLEIDRKRPDRTSTDRGATYQNFYNEVRLEYDSMRNSYSEARKHLEDQNFAKALAICDQFLTKFPGHALFQALKFDVEERQRQRLSSFVAEVDRRTEVEPDLERKEAILEEALVQFPGEPHFESSLKLIRNRLSLVNSIVSKARFHEERGQFSEALGQWEILKTIHDRYPGLDFEMDRLLKRRDQQTRIEAKSRWVEKIDSHFKDSEFDKALEAVKGALQEYPEDSELLALQKLTSQGVERKSEAQRALTEANGLFERGDFEAGMNALKRAQQLDPRESAIRSALTSKLIERARRLLDSDWRASSDLVGQALELDPASKGAKSLRILVEDRRREEVVNQAVAHIRELQSAGDLAGAAAQAEQSLALFAGEPRLVRLQEVLRSAIAESEAARPQAKELARMRALAAGAQLLAAPAQLREVLDSMSKISAQFPSDPEFRTLLEGVQRRYSAAVQAGEKQAREKQAGEKQPTIAAAPASMPGQPAPGIAAPVISPPVISSPVSAPPVKSGALRNGGLEPDATAVFLLPTPNGPPAGAAAAGGSPLPPPPVWTPSATSVSSQPPAPIAVTAPRAPRARVTSASALPARLKWGAVAVVLLAASVTAWLAFRPQPHHNRVVVPATPAAPADFNFQVSTSPAGASILVGGRKLGSSESQLHLPAGRHELTAEKDGFQPATFSVNLAPGSTGPFSVTLLPLAASFHLFTPFKQGDLSWDAKSSQMLADDGQLAIPTLDPGKHTLRIASGSSQATFSFEDQPLALPVIGRPQTSGIDAVVVAAYRDQAVLASSIANLPVLVDNQPAGNLVSGQIVLNDLAPGPHTLALGDWSGNFDSSPAPTVNLFLASLASQGRLVVEVQGADDAHILINAAERGITRKGRYFVSLDPGDYEVSAAHPGFLPAKPQKISVRKGGSAKLSFLLIKEPPVNPAPVIPTPVPQKLPGTVNLSLSPSNAEVRYTRGSDSNSQIFRQPSMELEAGKYVFTARAQGYESVTRTLEVASGASVDLNLKLAKLPSAPPSPIIHLMKAEDWDKPWEPDGAWYTRQGGDFVLYKVTPAAGVFHFAISPKASKGFFGMGGNPKMRWLINYTDPKNYIEFTLDKQSYSSDEYRDGKKIEHRKRTPHNLGTSYFRVQLTVAPAKILVQIGSGDDYNTVDEWSGGSGNFTSGQFGFHLPNQDRIYLTEFSLLEAPGAK